MTGKHKLKFGALEVGRGVAASLVVLHHSGSIVTQPRFFGEVAFGNHLANFNVGVDFFFVLSGFIIAWVHWADIGHPSRIRSYAVKRFVRIYPPYWVIVIPLIALYLAFPNAGIPSQRDPWNIVTSILLLPNIPQPVLGVAWTLVHEIFFYAVFAAIIAVGQSGLWLLPLWAIGIVAASVGGVSSFPASFFFSPFNIEFIMGVGAAILLRHRTIPAPFLFAVSGAIAFILMTLFAVHIQDNPLVGRLAFGSAAVAFVLGAVEMERARPLHLPRWLSLYGTSSYAVYLVHSVALSFLVQIIIRLLGRSLSVEVAVVAMAVLASALGILYHLMVEKPLTKAIRRVTEPGPSPAGAAT